MELSLDQKCVIVTGGTKGIGLSVVQGFLNEKAVVHVISRKMPEDGDFKELCNSYPGSLFFYACDITDENSLGNAFKDIQKVSSRIDIVVSNVGNGSSQSIPIANKDEWDKVWDVNFNSALYTARVFTSSLSKSKGVLIFIASIAGLEDLGAPSNYSTAKSALISFSKLLSRRLAPAVRVNVIAPGNIWIEDGTWDIKMKKNPEAVTNMLNEKVPLKRFGLSNEVSDLVLFMSSPRAAFITGGCFIIDGGQTVSF